MTKTTPGMDDATLALSLPAVSRLTSVGRSRLYEEIRAGRLPVVKVGRRTLVRRRDLEDWLAGLSAQQAQP